MRCILQNEEKYTVNNRAVYSEEIHPKLNEFYSTIGVVDSKEERLAKEEDNSKFHKEYVQKEFVGVTTCIHKTVDNVKYIYEMDKRGTIISITSRLIK